MSSVCSSHCFESHLCMPWVLEVWGGNPVRVEQPLPHTEHALQGRRSKAPLPGDFQLCSPVCPTIA